jgi:hypothetical protein
VFKRNFGDILWQPRPGSRPLEFGYNKPINPKERSMTGILTLKDGQIVDGYGIPVMLRGFGLGGWMNMENLITGFPASESGQREARGAGSGRAYEFIDA